MKKLFNISRFMRYANYQNLIHGRMLIFTILGMWGMLILFLIFVYISNNSFSAKNWTTIFFITGMFASIIFSGMSFPDFRKKESSVKFLMLPASVFEKFSYELIIRIILFPFVYIVLYYLSVKLLLLFFSGTKVEDIPVLFFLDKGTMGTPVSFLYTFYFLLSAVFFSGAGFIRRYPLLKTAIATTLVVFLIMGYNVLMDYLGVGRSLYKFISYANRNFYLLYWFFVFTGLTALVYTYYKIKEKTE